MEFTVCTRYDAPAMTAMARGLRKTLRAKRSRRSHILGWIIVALALLLVFTDDSVDGGTVITGLAAAVMILTFLFEDRLNGFIARKRGLPGLTESRVTFRERAYHSVTAAGTSLFPYENIQALAQTGNYIVFLFSQNHAQVYDMCMLEGGTVEEFRLFLEEKTGKKIQIL